MISIGTIDTEILMSMLLIDEGIRRKERKGLVYQRSWLRFRAITVRGSKIVRDIHLRKRGYRRVRMVNRIKR